MMLETQNFLCRLRMAWDAGDAASYASFFTEDATYVIFLGEVLVGRAQIQKNHVDVFERWQKGSKMIVTPLSVRDLSPDVRIILTAGGVGVSTPIGYDKLQTFTLVRHEGNWQCAAFQNTSMSDQARHYYRALGSGDKLPPLGPSN